MSNKLWLVGDSFGYIQPDDLNENVWSIQLARKLKCDLQPLCGLGTCQDWVMNEINFFKREITPDDQIVIILTDPARFWFYQDNPWLTNSSVIDFDAIIGNSERAKAAEYYLRYIQRPELDIIMLNHRLGWLNNLVSVKKWKKVIVLVGFGMYIPDMEDYPNLEFSHGKLVDISVGEETPTFEKYGIDVRYNHMCLSNHSILAEKIYNAIETNVPVDLNSGFIKNLLTSNACIDDPEFAKKELCPAFIKHYHSIPKKKVQGWRDKFRNKT
jgi:hypothetical protein